MREEAELWIIFQVTGWCCEEAKRGEMSRKRRGGGCGVVLYLDAEDREKGAKCLEDGRIVCCTGLSPLRTHLQSSC